MLCMSHDVHDVLRVWCDRCVVHVCHVCASSHIQILGYVSGLHPLKLTTRLLSYLPPSDHHSSLYSSLFTLQSHSTSTCTQHQLHHITHLIVSVYLNASACCMKMRRATRAHVYAHVVIARYDVRNGKAWQRRGDAYLMMGQCNTCISAGYVVVLV